MIYNYVIFSDNNISTKVLYTGAGPRTHKPSEQFKNLVCNEPTWQSSN